MTNVNGFIARVRHDLVKRLVWPARDRRDLGGRPHPGELRVALVDDEGSAITAPLLWKALRAEAPSTAPEAALEAFGAAVERADAAAAADDIEGVLSLEGALEDLARALRGP